MSKLNSIFRIDFQSFMRRCYRITNPGHQLDDSGYLQFLCYIAERIASGENRRQVINLPPAHLKTFLFSIALVAWILARDSTKRIMVVTNAQALAEQITYAIREIMRSTWFKELSDTRLKPDWSSAADFMTTRGGRVFATSADGKFTGQRADIIIVDDLLDIDEAHNDARVHEINNKFDTKISTRLNDPRDGTIVIVAHRLHDEDLSAHVMREDDWNIVALELVAERDRTYNMGAVNYHRKKGELLRPGLFSEEQIRSLRETVRIPEFQLFYQQGCGSRSALKLDRSDFPLFEAGTVSLLPIVISIDTAQKMSGSSRHAVQVWRTDGRDHYLIEAYSSASHYSDLRRGLARLTRKYPPSMILIEDASSGSMLVAELQVEGVTNVLPIIARGSKAERLAPHMATLKKRRVHLLHGAAWLGDWVSEILAFPSGRDDQVDALTQFLAYMANNPELNRCVPRERGMMAAALGSHGVRPATMQGSVLVTGSSFLRPPAPEHTSPPGPTLPVAQDPIPIVCGTADGAHIWWLK